MKIAVLGLRGFPNVQGGVEKHCENLYPFLAERGCEVAVFARAPYVDVSVRQYEGVKIIPLPCPKNKFLEAFVHTFYGIFAAKKLNPDILHIHAIGPSLFVPLARLFGLKVVMTHHGPDYMRKKWNIFAKMILRLGESFGVRWANEVICVSESAANHIRKKYKRDVTVIPNGVILPKLKGQTPKNKDNSLDILGKYGLEKEKYILAVGRFVPEKGFDDLIEAFNSWELGVRSWEGKINNCKLVIAGDADHEDKYSRELKRKAGRNRNVILTGFLSGQPLGVLYSNAGLFVLPSSYEGLPIALLEAMSYGLSCIASDIPANREVELSANRFFKPRDIEALALKIKEFIEVGCLNEEEKQEQLRIINEKYDWVKIADKTLRVYNKIYFKKVLNKD